MTHWLPVRDSQRKNWRDGKRYLQALLLLAAASGICALARQVMPPSNLVMIYLLAVVVSALYLGRGPSIFVAGMGMLVYDYFFVPPTFTFEVADTEYILTFLVFLGVGLLISQLTARANEQRETAQRREREATTLYNLTRDLTALGDLPTIIHRILDNARHFPVEHVVVVLRQGGEKLEAYPDEDQAFAQDELLAARQAMQSGMAIGKPGPDQAWNETLWLPLKTAQGSMGVLGMQPRPSKQPLPPEESRLLQAFADQAAVAIERVLLAEQARQAAVLEAGEKLQTALLNSISHDLRTPLVTVTGALSTLEDDASLLTEADRRSLIETAREEAERLNRLVGNLLDISRVEAGAVHVIKQPCDIQDVVGSTLEQLQDRLADRPVQIDIPADLPLIPLDFVLIVRVLYYILDNALKYSPPDSPLEIKARLDGDHIHIFIEDRGFGIRPENLSHVFDKFFRLKHPKSISGTGLGLAISKGFVEAHGGTISAFNREGGGTTLMISLPLE